MSVDRDLAAQAVGPTDPPDLERSPAPGVHRVPRYSTTSTVALTPSAAPAARATWRSAWITRPRLPMRRPMSPGSACTSSVTSSRALLDVDVDRVGVVDEVAGDVLDDGRGAATDDAVALGADLVVEVVVVVVVVVTRRARRSARLRRSAGVVLGGVVLGRRASARAAVGLGRGRSLAQPALRRRPPLRRFAASACLPPGATLR